MSDFVDDTTKLELLNYWIETHDISIKVPEILKNKISDEDIRNVLIEINPEHATIVEMNPDFETMKDTSIIPDIMRYRDNLEQRMERKRRAVNEEKLTKIQEMMHLSQWVIVIIMLITAGLSYKSYSMSFEQSRPNLQLFLDCPPYPADEIFNITAKIENSGMAGTYVGFTWSSPDGYIANPEYQGASFTLKNTSKVSLGPVFVKGNDFFVSNINMNITYLDVPNYRIYINAECYSPNCKFNTPKEFMCEYYKKDNNYLRDVSQCAR